MIYSQKRGTESLIEPELLQPPDLLKLIDEKEKNEGCLDCQVVGHLNWDLMEKAAQIQLYVCGDCPDAYAIICFARDMVRVLKLGLTPEYPQNFQHWIDELSNMKLSDSIADSNAVWKQIMKIKNKKVEFAFCASRPDELVKGTKSNVDVPFPCVNDIIVHNHPSGLGAPSEKDKAVACENNSVLCTVTKEKTLCYEPCTNELIEEVVH